MKRWIAIFALLCLANSAARGGEVSGRVALSGRQASSGVIVYLEGGAAAAPLAHAVVDQRDKAFAPHVSVITVGTTVEFPNNDTVFHNVFAYFRAKKFDLGMYPRGAKKRVTFDKPGVVALLCNVHSEMSAYILVVDTPYYATTDRQGKYHIPNVPPGTYTLHAWHESGATQTQTVTVRGDEAVAPLTLARK